MRLRAIVIVLMAASFGAAQDQTWTRLLTRTIENPGRVTAIRIEKVDASLNYKIVIHSRDVVNVGVRPDKQWDRAFLSADETWTEPERQAVIACFRQGIRDEEITCYLDKKYAPHVLAIHRPDADNALGSLTVEVFTSPCGGCKKNDDPEHITVRGPRAPQPSNGWVEGPATEISLQQGTGRLFSLPDADFADRPQGMISTGFKIALTSTHPVTYAVVPQSYRNWVLQQGGAFVKSNWQSWPCKNSAVTADTQDCQFAFGSYDLVVFDDRDVLGNVIIALTGVALGTTAGFDNMADNRVRFTVSRQECTANCQ